MATQGLQLPITLQIQNLQEIANQLKKFSNNNVLENSLGGKKIDAELTRVLHTLAQIELKSKNAFKTNADFSSLEREVNKVELSIEKIQGNVQNLKFDELKIPDSARDQLAELNAQITALKNNFNTFKASKRDQLLSNVDFTGNIAKAFTQGEAASILNKSYDDMYKAIDDGAKRINARLLSAKAEFELNSQMVTQNTAGKANFSAFGALSFVEEAFKKVDNAGKMSKQQQLLSEYMNLNEQTGQFDSWKRGAIGMNGFYKRLADEFKLDPAQLDQIRKNVQQAAKDANRTAVEEWQKIATDHTEGARVFGNGLSYADFKQSSESYAGQIKTRDTSEQTVANVQQQANAASEAYRQLMTVQQEVVSAQQALDTALRAPTASLQELQESIRQAIVNTPQLGAAFNQASQEIYNLRQAAEVGRQQLANLDQTLNKLSGVSNFINRYVGIYAIVRKVTTAVRNAFNNIKELDKNITNIAVVTNMSQKELWGKIGEYTATAQQYGVATKDVYTVSQIFYQQGLQTAQVMELTTETLKMAKIAGMEYSDAANAMTVAIRAFKIEMTQAQSVTDTYSALAAKFAVSSSEIANAMEKTASSAANVGMSLQSTSAFISVMTQTTRESAQNIGSALKSIISRYGEMKASPSSLLQVDGEEVAFNKVDTALQSIGISIKDASGQFRDFDDVIMELAQKWDTLDNNTQRYIATVMAGNRQQSRFIALVSNYDELGRAMETANNAQNASIVQTAKTMDSLETKAQQMKNAFSQIYLDLHLEDGLKNAYTQITKILKTIGKLGIGNGVLPTLMNIVGFGTGAKSLVNAAKEGVIKHRGDIEQRIKLKDEQAKQQATELQQMLEKEAIKRVQVQVDTAQMQSQLATMNTQLEVKTKEQTALINSINSYLPGGKVPYTLKELQALSQKDSAAIRTSVGLKVGDPDSKAGKDIIKGIEEFQALETSITSLKNTIGNLSMALEDMNRAARGVANSDDNKRNAAEQAASADRQKTQSAGEAANADRDKAQASGESANADREEAQSSGEAGNADRDKAQASGEAANADREEAQSSRDAAQGDREEAVASRVNSTPLGMGANQYPVSNQQPGANQQPGSNQQPDVSTGLSWRNWGTGNARTYTGIVSGVARMAGTAIVAAGAAHEDKSNDEQETSKILTGVGNGISMAGTGASMLMGLGPWGAVVGAIGGFLIGGLGAIIDGATVTLEERLAMQKEEAKKASEASLKAQAKTTDIDAQLDNLKKLQKNMYNSTEDMQAYTDAMNTMGKAYPELISTYDSAGNAILDLEQAEQLLLQTRLASSSAAEEAAVAEYKARQTEQQIISEFMTRLQGITSGKEKVSGSGGGAKVLTIDPLKLKKTRDGNEIAYINKGGSTTDRDNTGEALLKAFEALRKDDYMPPDYDENKEIRELLTYYRNNPQAEVAIEDLSTIGHFLAGPGLASYSKDTEQRIRQNYGYWADKVAQGKNNVNYADTGVEKELDEFLKSRASELHIEAPTGEYQDKWARKYFGWAATGEISYEQLIQAYEKLEKLTGSNQKIKESLDKEIVRTSAQVAVDDKLIGTSGKKTEIISGSKIFTNMLAQGLELAAKQEEIEGGAAAWATQKDNSAFLKARTEINEAIFTWIDTLTDTQLQEFIDATSNMSIYAKDDFSKVLAKFGIDKNPELAEALYTQFAEENEQNRNRILKTVYAYDENGNRIWGALNSQMTGLAKLNGDEVVKDGQLVYDNNGNKMYQNYAKDIAYKFIDTEHGGPESIITEYADYFANQIATINQLASDGYETLAGNRLKILYDFSNNLAELTSEQQHELFPTISNIDFNNIDSIKKAQKAIETYRTNKGITDTADGTQELLNNLAEAANILFFNINTLAQNITSSIINASKELDSILATNNSGLSFDKAIEEFQKISSQFTEVSDFSQIFSYDATLGKYVYTSDGLTKAIAVREQNLADHVTELNKLNTLYAQNVGTVDDNGNVTLNNKQLTGIFSKGIFDSKDNAKKALQEAGLITGKQGHEQQDELYENLVNDFIKQYEISDQTAENWNKFLEDRIKKGNQESQAALKLKAQYDANSKDRLYSSIDWNKLATGEDYFGTNQTLLEALALQLNDFSTGTGEYDEYGNEIREFKKGVDLSDWQAIQNASIEQFYGTDEKLQEELEAAGDDAEKIAAVERKKAAKNAAKTAAQTATKQAKSTQVSTAIEEVLAGNGKILSSATQTLLNQTKDLNINIVDGVITGAKDYVQTALDLYNAHRKNLTTVAEKNKEYLSIINASFKPQQAAQTLLSAGSTLDFSTIESTFTDMGLTLDEYWDAGLQGWKADKFPKGIKPEDVFSTDIFGKTTITNWDNYLKFLKEAGADITQIDAKVLAKYRRAYIDSTISEANDLDLDKAAASQISSLSGAKVGDRINISEIKDLLGKTEDSILIQTEEELNRYITTLESKLADENWVKSNPQEATAIRSAVATWKTKFNQNEAWKGVIAENVAYSSAQTLQSALNRTVENTDSFMESLGYRWNDYTKQFIAGDTAVQKLREELARTSPSNKEAVNSLQALIDNLEDTKKYKSMKALQDALSNYTNITNEQIAAFNTQFEGIDLHKFITKDVTGKQKLNVSSLRAALKGMGQDINELFGEEIASIMDANMSNLTSAINYTISGTTNTADMQKFLKEYKDLTGISLDNAFNYSDILDAWTLDPQVLQAYVQAQGQELVNLGLLDSKELNKYVNDNVQKKLAENIDINAFLEAENKSNDGEAYKTLKNALVTYLKSSDEVFQQARKAYIDAKTAEKTNPAEMEKAAKQASRATTDEISEYYINQLKQGGAAAVEVMRAVAKAQRKELTTSDVEAAYRSEVSQLENAFDQLSYGVGGLISGQAKAIFDAVDKAGKYHIEIDDTTAVITATLEEISSVYQEYYDMLLKSGEATLAAVNEAKAKILETQNGNATEQAAIDALGNASGMTYTAFAEILSNAGIEMTDELMEQLTTDKVIEAMGGNKMRIRDFNRFAEGMGWEFNSEEYLSAYKTFNDGLIELNRKTEKNITEEIKGLEEAKSGDWINLSDFSHALSKKIVTHVATDIDNQLNNWETGSTHRSTALYDLNTKLIPFGAQIVNGILKLSDNANLLEIANSIKDAAASAELDLKDGFQELADAIKNILKGYVDAITSGIEGGLTNVEASDLVSKAKDLGVNNIDFTETAEGLKLSEQSAIALYNALKQVDGLQATLVFDKLKNSLEQTNENFASTSALIAHIADVSNAIKNADREVSDARLQQYQAELSVAQEILAVRSTSEDNSFNFMSNEIPAAQKNPLNYAKNWTQALHTMRDAFKADSGTKKGKTGFIDYEDWYNIATEINNIAALGGPIQLGALEFDGSLEAASKAIQAGCDSLTAIDTGELKVNLRNSAIDIQSGTSAMQSSVTSGIQAMAKSQVKMLDGLIAMLEIIVAMEQLGEITGEDTQIDLGDIFVTSDENGKVLKEITEFTDGFDKARQKLIDYVNGNKELKERFENTQINFNGQMRSMMEMLGDGQTKTEMFNNLFGGLTDDDKKKAQEAYQTMLNGLYQAAISGDYDLNDIGASVQKVLKQSGVDLSEFVFNVMEDGKLVRTLTFVGETAIEIDYTDEDARKAVDTYLHSNKYAKDQAAYTTFIQDALNKYKTKKDEGRIIQREELINLRTLIGIASNEFVMSGDDKTGYTGYFDGKKFEGKNNTELLALMGEAAMYKDKGLDFEVALNNDGKQVIKGKTTISGIDIEVSLDNNGEPRYTYNGRTGSKEFIMGLIAKEGRQTETGTYTFTDEGKEYSVQVTRAIGLDLTYSYYNDGTPHYVYDGHDFGDNYDSMYNYMKVANQLDTKDNGKWEKGDATTGHRIITLSEKAKIEIQIKQDGTIKTTLNLDGQSFDISTESAQAAAQAYIEASSMEGFEDISGANAGAKRTVQFRSGGYTIEAEIDITAGTTKYTYNDGKTVYSSDSLSGLQAYLDTILGKDLENGDSGKTFTIKKKVIKGKGEAEVEVEIHVVDGKVNVDDAHAAGMTDEEIAALEAKLAKQSPTLENTVEATASEVKVVTEGADISLDVDTLEVKDPIDIKVKAKNIIVEDEDTGVKPPNEPSVENPPKQNLYKPQTISDFYTPQGTPPWEKFSKQTEQKVSELSETTLPPIQQEFQIVETTPTVEDIATNISSSSLPATIEAMVARASGAISNLETCFGEAQGSITTHLTALNTAAQNVFHTLREEVNQLQQHVSITGDIDWSLPDGTKVSSISGFRFITDEAQVTVKPELAKDAKTTIESGLKDIKVTLASPSTQPILDALVGPFTAKVQLIVDKSGLPKTIPGGSIPEGTQATGNIGFARAKGTLMGELGPELVVSNGRYFVAGQSGPEMVNLADDAIVFNHLQTKSLLEKGTSKGRGRAITNEQNAVAFAKGSVHGGPAMASAAAALAALKQLRAQWASLAQLSVEDLMGKGGGGGGGGGGGQFLRDLEKWYNWLQRIAQLEKDIAYYEAYRNRISSEWAPNGRDYFHSQKDSLEALQEQLAVQKDLTASQEAYFNKRRAEMNSKNNPFTALYTFDENGQLKYKPGAMEKLSKIASRDPNTGKPNMTDEEQYKAIIALNPKYKEFMKYDNSGKEIDGKDFSSMVKAFWEKIDTDKEEMQSLHDSVEEGYKKQQELEQQQNELIKEMRDNQMELETSIYNAIVDTRQRAIDKLTDTKEAITSSNEKYIKGLTDVLQKEQNMYQLADSQQELDRLRNKRDILVRSGGSAAEIASLNDQITDQERSLYFDKQQEQIDAIQAASDKQIEKLEAQIQLETEILEYQKKHGLLWAEVTDIMSRSPQEIARYIHENDSSYWDKSPVASEEALQQTIFKAEQWTDFRDEGIGVVAGDVAAIRKKVAGDIKTDTDKDTGKDTGKKTGDKGKDSGKGKKSKGTGKWDGKSYGQDGQYHWKIITFSDGSKGRKDKEPHVWVKDKLGTGYECSVCGRKSTHYIPGAYPIRDTLKRDHGIPMGNGGLVTNPTHALIGETGQPEAVLNPTQTRILRENILSNRPNSLINLLKSYNEAYQGLPANAYDSISNNSNTMQIDKAEVNLHIDKLANDYDSRQAARTVMDEMLRIASKTKANNSVRR